MSGNARRARDIFIAAIGTVAPERWDAYLAEACGGDAELHRRVRNLLRAHREGGSFLEAPAAGLITDREAPVTEGPGAVLGPYQLLEAIGEGGFGVVFRAEQQQPIRRQVALKVLKPGMDSRQVIARFEAERQALALMDHPNIARVLDAGATASGRPYFVMELVPGVAITDYCDQNQLTPRARLELFVPVCQAVQHAHQKGIIHRDLKPSNVLVTRHDGVPVVKVIDFGIAKALGQQLTDKTLLTGFAQLIGTPLYMSPEQAEMSGLDVDTRSDIYSLGVLLYELLAGTTPFDQERLKQAGYDEVRRILREEEPPRPSARLSTLGQAAATVSARRQSDPRRLRQLFRGELDWVVLKALEKDRNRRYESASALAADVERYLHDEPIQACPPSAWYRFRKFARRNKVWLGTLSAVSVAVVLAVAVLVVSLVVIDRERTEAMRQRDDAQAQRQRARRAVDRMYTEVAEKWLAQQPRLEPLQKQFLEEALHFYEEFAQEHSSDPELRLETAKAHCRVGQIRHRLGETALAEEAFAQAIRLLEQLVADYPAQATYRSALADSHYHLGQTLATKQELALAEKELARCVVLRQQLVADFPDAADHGRDLAGAYLSLANVEANRGLAGKAEGSYRQAIALLDKLPAALAETAACRLDLARCLQGLGAVLAGEGRPAEAEKSLHQAVALLQKLSGDAPTEPDLRHRLAWGLRVSGEAELAEAEPALRRALLLSEKLAADFPAVPDYRFAEGLCRHCLGRLLRHTGRPQEAVEMLRRAAQLYEKLATEYPALHQYRAWLGLSHHLLAEALGDAGRPQEAEKSYRQALAILSRVVAEYPAVEHYSLWLALCYGNLAELFTVYPEPPYRNPTEALELARRAVEVRPDVRQGWNALGIAHYRTGNHQSAVTALEKSVELGKGGYWFDWFFLAMAHAKLGHQEEARRWYDRATRWLEKEKEELGRNKPMEAQYRRYRSEAAEVLGLTAKQD
jgi:serine/threonine protein kinase/Tfp pilus assembly protein PilF